MVFVEPRAVRWATEVLLKVLVGSSRRRRRRRKFKFDFAECLRSTCVAQTVTFLCLRFATQGGGGNLRRRDVRGDVGVLLWARGWRPIGQFLVVIFFVFHFGV